MNLKSEIKGAKRPWSAPVAPRPAKKRKLLPHSFPTSGFCLLLSLCLCVSAVDSARAQVESVAASPSQPTWVSHGRIEGHLALAYSPAGAFSLDSATLAVAESDGKVALMDLASSSIKKVLHPRIEGIADLDIESANFLDPQRLFILAKGLYHTKGSGLKPRTPLLAFQWDTASDSLSGKADTIGGDGGYGPIVYVPQFKDLVIYKDSAFQVWNPADGRSQSVSIVELKNRPNVYALSPDGHWLLLAQIQGNTTPDPIVVQLSAHKFVDSLRGHRGTVLGIAFSRDSKSVLTACEDGKVRVWSVPDWKLLQTLSGHSGPVHWAEFSDDGRWIASAGEDHTVRIWSASDGKLVQTLAESPEPLCTVAFSPDGRYVAASSESAVLVWQRQ